MKYLFFDIDNTLISHVNQPHVPNETRIAINKLREAGHVPAIATGRAYFLAKLATDEFGIDTLVCSGGAELIVKGELIQRLYFPDEHISKFLDVAKNFPELTATVDEKYLYTDESSGFMAKYFNAQAGYNCVKPLREMKRALMCYIMIPPKNLTPQHGIFYAPPEGVKLELMNHFTEARHENTSKWRGIEQLINFTHANIDDVITFGDGPNDIDMIKNARVGVAVARSSEKVKAAANLVCDDIDEGGILKACYELGLIESV